VRSSAKAAQLSLQLDEVVEADALHPASLAGTCEGIDAVISCLGASVDPNARERRSYTQLDVPANLHLLGEARRAGVKHFVYTAAFVAPGYAHTRYIQAHEQVVAALRQAPMSASILRPTGFFSAFAAFVPMAAKGPLPLLSGGAARSNPIHPADLAAVAVRALRERNAEYPVGGPEVLTRRETAALAFTAQGKAPKFIAMPAVLMRLMAFLLRPFHPRMSDLLQFVAAVSVTDCVAPAAGQRRLADFYREQVRATPKLQP
jgi:uncharacterized protein YbjT (DUF2867 family)